MKGKDGETKRSGKMPRPTMSERMKPIDLGPAPRIQMPTMSAPAFSPALPPMPREQASRFMSPSMTQAPTPPMPRLPSPEADSIPAMRAIGLSRRGQPEDQQRPVNPGESDATGEPDDVLPLRRGGRVTRNPYR